jgi:hypothetical protein
LRKWPFRTGLKLVAISILFWSVGANAADHVRPLTAQCLKETGQSYGIHTDVLLAFLYVEGGTVGQNSKSNSNGTYDIGLFQINSMHRKAIAALGISEDRLRNDGCVNAKVAAWHLKNTLTPEVLAGIHNEDDYLHALALYHSATPKYNQIYAEKLRRAFQRIYASEQQ